LRYHNYDGSGDKLKDQEIISFRLTFIEKPVKLKNGFYTMKIKHVDLGVLIGVKKVVKGGNDVFSLIWHSIASDKCQVNFMNGWFYRRFTYTLNIKDDNFRELKKMMEKANPAKIEWG